jgi:uncharacterized protein YlxP (DUF503 family)
MITGMLEIRLMVREARSLKDKRRVIKSLRDRIRNKFNVSIAEVGALDSHQQAVIGVAAVGNDQQFVNSVLSSVINHMSANPHAELVDYEMEFYS